jgi:hypothetical protein
MYGECDPAQRHRERLQARTLRTQGWQARHILTDETIQQGGAGESMVGDRHQQNRIMYTIGFTQKSLRQFVTLLRDANVDGVVDIRQNNTSQLAGFAKRDDLAFILETQDIGYMEEKRLAPTPDLLQRYHAGLPWSAYVTEFDALLAERPLRDILRGIAERFARPCLLCAEPAPEHCHRRLVAEAFARLQPGLEIRHLTLAAPGKRSVAKQARRTHEAGDK